MYLYVTGFVLPCAGQSDDVRYMCTRQDGASEQPGDASPAFTISNADVGDSGFGEASIYVWHCFPELAKPPPFCLAPIKLDCIYRESSATGYMSS